MLFLILLLLGLCSKSLASFSYNEAESKRMLYYSAAVYCRDLLNAKKFSCASCGLAGVEGVEVYKTYWFAERKQYAAMFVDHNKKQIIVSFRGTDPKETEHIILNLSIQQYELGAGKGEVHVGFFDTWVHLRSDIMPDFEFLAKAYEDYRLFIVGHSLGGAIATLAAVEIAPRLKKANIDVDSRLALYTYGAPKIGDDAWAKYANSIFTFTVARVVHWRDPVVAVPPFGYALTKNEVFYQNGMANGDYEKCSSGTDGCSHDLFFHSSFSNHATYFDVFVGWHCYPEVKTPAPTPVPSTTTGPTSPPYTGPTRCFDAGWLGELCLPWSTETSTTQQVLVTATDPVSTERPVTTVGLPTPVENTQPCVETTYSASNSPCVYGVFGVSGVCVTAEQCAAQHGEFHVIDGSATQPDDTSIPDNVCGESAPSAVGCCTHCKSAAGSQAPPSSTPLNTAGGDDTTTTAMTQLMTDGQISSARMWQLNIWCFGALSAILYLL